MKEQASIEMFRREHIATDRATAWGRPFAFRIKIPCLCDTHCMLNRRYLGIIGVICLFVYSMLQLRSASGDVVMPSVPVPWAESPGGRGQIEYSVMAGFFLQSEKKTEPASFDYTRENFGLKHRKYKSDHDKWVKTDWERFEEYMTYLQQSSDDRTQYKLLFMGRHGEGFHNVAEAKYGTPAWNDLWSKFPEYTDAHLTAVGVDQAKAVNAWWKTIIERERLPTPESFYTSPLARCLETARITFTGLNLYKDRPFRPIVKELARETMGVHTCDKRSSRSWIASNYADYEIESGFSEEDQLWQPDKRETPEELDIRQRKLLDDIFLHDSHSYISISSHSGAIASILRIVGHQPFPLTPGGVIPVLVKAQRVT